ncbi:hypothetical protein NL676_037191 [Syzygium grande]|nr:hypothetical protein NL676_037191 [Syzygium grande]
MALLEVEVECDDRDNGGHGVTIVTMEGTVAALCCDPIVDCRNRSCLFPSEIFSHDESSPNSQTLAIMLFTLINPRQSTTYGRG